MQQKLKKNTKKSGYNFKQQYKPTNQNKNKISRERNITRFNPPFSKTVSTKICQYLIFWIRTSQKVKKIQVFPLEITSKLAIAAPKT